MGGVGHNGGPPITDDHVAEWRDGDPFVYFAWKHAHGAVRREVPWHTMIARQKRADALGLTYDEYTLEILERGRHLSAVDARRIEQIKQRRTPVDAPSSAQPPPRELGRTASRVQVRPLWEPAQAVVEPRRPVRARPPRIRNGAA